MVGLLLVLLAVWQIQVATQGADGSHPLEVVTESPTSPPLTIIAPTAATQAPRPLVLIGHGTNPRPLPSSTQGDSLVANTEAERRGLVAPDRVAILGHSMGSGVALEFGQERIMKRTEKDLRGLISGMVEFADVA